MSDSIVVKQCPVFPSLEKWLAFEHYLEQQYPLSSVDAAKIVRHVIHELLQQNPDGSIKNVFPCAFANKSNTIGCEAKTFEPQAVALRAEIIQFPDSERPHLNH